MRKKTATEFGLVPLRHPCSECPFRRTSLRGWLGSRDVTPVDYVLTALSDHDIGCHLSPGYPTGDLAMIRSCAGLAIFRRNVCKQPRGGTARNAVAIVQPDCTTVFKLPQEFIDHHTIKKVTPA